MPSPDKPSRPQPMHVPVFPGTRDLAGSRHSGLGRGDLDHDFDPLPTRRPLPPFSDPLFDDEETVFDIRGQRTSRPRRLLGDEFANEVAATTNRLKARLNLATESIFDDKVKEGSRSARSALDEAESAFRRRPRFEGENGDLFDEVKPSLTKWTKLADQAEEEFNSAAKGRAQRSKARLDDLEAEMEEMAEKQARREKRAAALKAMINDANSTADDFFNNSSSKMSSSSVHKSEKSEKHVSF